jgi:hypothetical protein
MKWIAVSDRLPPHSVPLLLYYDYQESQHSHGPTHIQKIIIGHIMPGCDKVLGDHWQYTKLGITHWMYRPEYPAPFVYQKKSRNDVRLERSA